MVDSYGEDRFASPETLQQAGRCRSSTAASRAGASTITRATSPSRPTRARGARPADRPRREPEMDPEVVDRFRNRPVQPRQARLRPQRGRPVPEPVGRLAGERRGRSVAADAVKAELERIGERTAKILTEADEAAAGDAPRPRRRCARTRARGGQGCSVETHADGGRRYAEEARDGSRRLRAQRDAQDEAPRARTAEARRRGYAEEIAGGEGRRTRCRARRASTRRADPRTPRVPLERKRRDGERRPPAARPSSEPRRRASRRARAIASTSGWRGPRRSSDEDAASPSDATATSDAGEPSDATSSRTPRRAAGGAAAVTRRARDRHRSRARGRPRRRPRAPSREGRRAGQARRSASASSA